MVYYRNRKYRPYRRRRRRYRRRKPMRYKVADAAYSALKMAKRLKDAVNIEYKHHDVTITTTDVDYNGDVITLNNPAQGDSDNSRDGDSMKCQNLVLRYFVSHTAKCFVRVIVYWDQQNTVSAASSLLDAAQVGTVQAPIAYKDYDNRFKSKILHDRTFNIDPASKGQFFVDTVIKIDRHTQFEAGSTTINTGALKILLVSNLAPTNNVYLEGLARLTYTDN